VLDSLRSIDSTGAACEPQAGAASEPQTGAASGANGRGGPPSVRFLDLPVIDVSSSAARQRVANGEPIEDLVGADVAAYIAEHGLYRGSPS
jgi:nicotinic acid mononucleotide adenylyltransferase